MSGNLLPREQVEQILHNLDPKKVIALAYANFYTNLSTGCAMLDLFTGELYGQEHEHRIFGELQPEEELKHGQLIVYTVPASTEFTLEDIYNKEELQKYYAEKKHNSGIYPWEVAHLSVHDIREREAQSLLNKYRLDWGHINRLLDTIYEKKEEFKCIK